MAVCSWTDFVVIYVLIVHTSMVLVLSLHLYIFWIASTTTKCKADIWKIQPWHVASRSMKSSHCCRLCHASLVDCCLCFSFAACCERWLVLVPCCTGWLLFLCTLFFYLNSFPMFIFMWPTNATLPLSESIGERYDLLADAFIGFFHCTTFSPVLFFVFHTLGATMLHLQYQWHFPEALETREKAAMMPLSRCFK